MSKNRIQATRILGIDFGMSRLGLALSDETKIIAMPHSTLTAEKKTELTIKKLVETIAQINQKQNCCIEQIVIGLPLMMSGVTGFLADEVKHFADVLAKFSPIPILLWDERLTTVQAERSLREGSLTRKKRSKVVDMVSATIILQSYLDTQKRTFPENNENSD
jgi:putative Holliday junction resolvase